MSNYTIPQTNYSGGVTRVLYETSFIEIGMKHHHHVTEISKLVCLSGNKLYAM